ncbi:MAG: hypothetical protein R3F43_03620 [bacterium]
MTPRILLTFANEAATEARYLRALQAEVRALRAALAPAKQAGLCELQVETNASVETLVAALQSARNTKDLAIFHFAGHASGDALSLEGEGASAHAGAGSNARPAAGAAPRRPQRVQHGPAGPAPARPGVPPSSRPAGPSMTPSRRGSRLRSTAAWPLARPSPMPSRPPKRPS